MSRCSRQRTRNLTFQYAYEQRSQISKQTQRGGIYDVPGSFLKLAVFTSTDRHGRVAIPQAIIVYFARKEKTGKRNEGDQDRLVKTRRSAYIDCGVCSLNLLCVGSEKRCSITTCSSRSHPDFGRKHKRGWPVSFRRAAGKGSTSSESRLGAALHRNSCHS